MPKIKNIFKIVRGSHITALEESFNDGWIIVKEYTDEGSIIFILSKEIEEEK